MKYIEEYRDRKIIADLAASIKNSADDNYTFMEVCGGHTSAIHRFGIPSLLPEQVKLISGPGCPVCVTTTDFIDRLVACSRLDGVIITTFGDLLRIPGSESSLEKARSAGADIRIVFSGLDALEIAASEPDKSIIFTGIGFETTAPGTAVTVSQAAIRKLNNFFVLSAHKVMPPAMAMVAAGGVQLDGFICPGHVAAITGSEMFGFLPHQFGLGCVVSGFEPSDILQSILMLIRQKNEDKPSVEIQYTRVVTPEGNLTARKQMDEVFELCDTSWRGFGVIRDSGLKLRSSYKDFDAAERFRVVVEKKKENPACICGDILRGLKHPPECSLFRGVCTPENPVGACMVSAEGACNAYYRYM